MPAFRNLMKRADLQQQQRAEAVGKLLNIGLAGLGVGAATRGIVGLRDMLSRQRQAVPFVSPGPSILPVPVLKNAPPEDEAIDEDAVKLAWAKELSDTVSNTVAGWLPDNTSADLGLSELASSPSRAHYMIPAGVMLGAGGLAGGWGLTDWILKNRRKAEQQSELDDARRDYQHSLTEQFHAKQAADDPYAGLDALYDALEKQSGDRTWGDTAQVVPGIWETALAGTGAGSAYLTYKWLKSRSQAKLLDKAMQVRSRQLWSRTPQPVFAVPKEVHVEPQQEAA